MAIKKFYPATLDNQTAIIEKLNALALDIAPIGQVIYHTKTVAGDTVTLRWKDPVDGPRVTWLKTVVVKKLGSAPESPTDGTVVITSTVRDEYANIGYIDTQADANRWYYRAFPMSVQGAVSYSAENIFTPYTVYEFYIDEGLSNPDEMVAYEGSTTGAAPITINKTVDPSPTAINWGSWKDAFFMPRPCMLKSNGDVDYYLNPEDMTSAEDGQNHITEQDAATVTAWKANTKYTVGSIVSSNKLVYECVTEHTSGTAFDDLNWKQHKAHIAVMSYDGNAMMEFPLCFMSAEKRGERIHIKIADQKLDDTFECFPCLKEDGTHASAFYMPIYEGYIVNGKMRSVMAVSGTILVPQKCNSGTNQSTQVTNARANGEGWDVTTQAQEELIKALGVLVFKTLDIPSACGGGRSVTASSAQIVIGGGNQFGMFGGKFDGSWTTTKFFGMENWWGHVNRRVLGCVILDNEWLVKMTKHGGDGTGVEDYVWSDVCGDYAGKYVSTGIHLPTTYNNAYITEMSGEFEAEATEKTSAIFLPRSAVGGGSAVKYCDALYTSTGLKGVLFGGNASLGAFAGPFYVNANHAPSYAAWYCGASLSYTRF